MKARTVRPRRLCAAVALAFVTTASALATEPGVAPASKTPGAKRTAEQMRLDTTTIKGHEGLPRVLYIVPWKRSDAGDLPGRPAASLLDEVLAPVDRTEFRRQLRYYDALNTSADTADGKGPANP